MVENEANTSFLKKWHLTQCRGQTGGCVSSPATQISKTELPRSETSASGYWWGGGGGGGGQKIYKQSVLYTLLVLGASIHHWIR